MILFDRLNDSAVFERKTEGAAGFDMAAQHDVDIPEGCMGTILLGIRVVIPKGHVGLLAIRSSLAMQGVRTATRPGIIDADFRGELRLPVHGPCRVMKGQRVAQLVVVPCMTEAGFCEIDPMDTPRGEGGFGSTGV
jgi:dUTP pyrophosphatase